MRQIVVVEETEAEEMVQTAQGRQKTFYVVEKKKIRIHICKHLARRINAIKVKA